MCNQRTLDDIKSEYNSFRSDCCPDLNELEFVERNINVQRLFGLYPASMPSMKMILLETIGQNIRDDVNLIKDIITLLTEEEIEQNLINHQKWEVILDYVARFCIREKREVFVKRSNKFSNLLNSNLVDQDFLKEKLIALFNARHVGQKNLHLEISGSPESIIYMSTDAKFTSCQNWKLNQDRGCDVHNASHSVWANLEDPTMCTATLIDDDGDRLARSVIRVVEHEHINYVYIQRIHSVSPYNIIMKQTLSSLVLPNGYTSVPLFDGNKDCIGPMILYPVEFTLTSHDVLVCSTCKGIGTEETDCHLCNGAHITKITCDACSGSGELLDITCGVCGGEGTLEEECGECVDGYIRQPCSACDGNYLIPTDSYGGIITPYSDHEEISFDTDSIVFMLPEPA